MYTKWSWIGSCSVEASSLFRHQGHKVGRRKGFFFAFVFGRFAARRKETDSRGRFSQVYSGLARKGLKTLDHASQRERSSVPAGRSITDGQSFLPTMPQVT
ncbi:unnamed protein product [Ectocarpus sp. 13 AM-2016]